MLAYIFRRILWMIPIMLGVAIVIFTLMFFIPGDPISATISGTSRDLELAREIHGLNQPYFTRLWNYMSGVFLRFDFGLSWNFGTRVTQDLMGRLPRTAILAGVSMFFSVIIGIPLGIVAATRHNKLPDRISMVISMFGVSMPPFWLAVILVSIFAVKLGWLPSFGIGGIKYYILPALANCFQGVTGFARQTRSSILDNIRSDYVSTARAKGVSERRILWSHIMTNSLIPIITFSGAQASRLLVGAVVVENVFSIPGLGSYIVTAISKRDYNAVQGTVIFIAVLFALLMLLVDIVYAYVDPRIKSQYTRKLRRSQHG